MKSSKTKFFLEMSMALALSSALAAPAMADADQAIGILENMIPQSVVIANDKKDDPNYGEVISVKKDGDQITIRHCARFTLKEDVEKTGGCAVMPGTQDMVLSVAGFRAVGLNMLQTQKLDHLLERRKERFEDEFGGKAQAQAGANCHPDSDFNDIGHLDKSLDKLIAKMDGDNINEDLTLTKDSQGIAFNLLKTIANPPTCSPDQKDANLAVGSICQTKAASGTVLWQVSSDSHGNRLYTDTKSNLTVTGIVAGGRSCDFGGNQANGDEVDTCARLGYQLPSAGVTDWDNWDDMDRTDPKNQTGQFMKLNADGIRNVIPGIQNFSFWSSSPVGSGNYFIFIGSYGGISYDDCGPNHDNAVLCMAPFNP